MTIQIDVWSDFVCPWCYAVSFSLKELQQIEDVSYRWHAYELRPEGSPPMSPDYLRKIETESRPRFNQMMREMFELEMKPGPFGIVSRLALAAEKYAEEQGVSAFHDAAFNAYWLDSRDISDLAVLRDITESVGMDGEAFESTFSNPAQRAAYESRVVADIRQAYAYGLQGVPAIIIENRYLVPGYVPTGTLREVIKQVKADSS
jgi:predicted DsbA family dithiol-disulfide isomerase